MEIFPCILVIFVPSMFQLLRWVIENETWHRELRSILFLLWVMPYHCVTIFILIRCWAEEWVQNDIKQVINHSRKHISKQMIRLLKTRVCVNFNKNGVHLLIKNKVITKELKSVFLLKQFAFHWFKGVNYDFTHIFIEILFQSLFRHTLYLRMERLISYMLEQCVHWYNITILKFTVVFTIFLDSIISNNLNKPNKTFTIDGASYPGKNSKHYDHYKIFLINKIKKDKISKILFFKHEKISPKIITIYIKKKCYDSYEDEIFYIFKLRWFN